MRIRLILAAAPLLLAASVWGDEIHLKNGNSIEGIVRTQTEDYVFLDLGAGSMRIRTGAVKRVDRSSPEEAARIENEWKEKYFLSRKYVPQGMEELVNRLQALEDQRAGAVLARRSIDSLRTKERTLSERIGAEKANLVESSRKLMSAVPEKDPAAYNALVLECNRLRSTLTVEENDLEQVKKQQSPAFLAVDKYLDALAVFEGDLQSSEDKIGVEDGASRHFLEKLTTRFREMADESRQSTVRVKPSRRGFIVSAVVNGSVSGDFLLDTGAAVVSLSEAFARRLNLPDSASQEEIQVVMADGSKSPAKAVVLKSVQLGSAIAQDVAAVIIPTAVEDGIDGLLGMSFLDNFRISMNGGTGDLVLREFIPR